VLAGNALVLRAPNRNRPGGSERRLACRISRSTGSMKYANFRWQTS